MARTEQERAHIRWGNRRRLALVLSGEMPHLTPEEAALCAAPEYDDEEIGLLAGEIKAILDAHRALFDKPPYAGPRRNQGPRGPALRSPDSLAGRKRRIVRKGTEMT